MGLEIAFKGGQIGDDAYFESVRTKPLPEFRRVSMGRFQRDLSLRHVFSN
jgi:hypothetical protein